MDTRLFPDSTVLTAAALGRKPALAGRTRQQLQRGRALQSAVKNTGPATSSLPPEQQLVKQPPRQEHQPLPGTLAAAPAREQEMQQKVVEEKQQPPVEEAIPDIKELEKQVAELLVWFIFFLSTLSVELPASVPSTEILKLF